MSPSSRRAGTWRGHRPGGSLGSRCDCWEDVLIMRVLFVSCPSAGHVYPMFSLAWALRAAGHEVLVASSAAIAQDIREAGLAAVATHGPVGTAEGMMHGRTFDENAGA